jgi:hypothetical protein
MGIGSLERKMRAQVFYGLINPMHIFGMVGRCGGGYNTVWEDWSHEGRVARENIMQEYEEGLNKICGHYSRLESSILREGFRNPLIVTCGRPVRRKGTCVPPEFRSLTTESPLFLEGVTGGSRLWVAQKYNIPVPCLINDFVGRYDLTMKVIYSASDARAHYKDSMVQLTYSKETGISEAYDNGKTGYHLDPAWTEAKVVRQRAPLWVSTMNKYGYYVDRLQPFVLDILKDADVVQPEHLKKKITAQ